MEARGTQIVLSLLHFDVVDADISGQLCTVSKSWVMVVTLRTLIDVSLVSFLWSCHVLKGLAYGKPRH